MTFVELIQKAVPGLSAEDAESILWERTPFPFESNPRMLAKKARGYARACANDRVLCDFCDTAVTQGWLCNRCNSALAKARTGFRRQPRDEKEGCK